ncbi:MAG TPA: hypothetical protein DCP11_12490 [Microbacteriaceae bacterium]|nr:hypothetical protein [Microbacteriaceae bacterium]
MGAVLAVSAAVILHLVAQLSMLLTRADWSLSSFRNYFASDQLSYMGIVADAAHGRFGNFEPFTETGSIYYPRFYYLVIGGGAHLFGLQPTTAWAIGGLLAQITLVVVVAVACIVMSGKLWTGVLAAGPFVLGTFSTVTDNNWFTQLDSHAVLWGPFGVLFTLNAESAGLCAGGIALLLLLLAYARLRRRTAKIIVVSVASVVIGALANVQTYSFLTTVYLAIYVVAAYALVTGKRKWPIYLSVLFIPVLFLLGPTVAHRGSPLVTLIFGLLPAVPGAIILLVRSRGLVALYFGLTGLAASPSVLGTLIGLSNRDPFLVYRVASSKNLGVEWDAGLVASTVLAVPLILVFIAGLHRRRKLWIAYPAGVGVAWVLLSTNDIWGANQEPYRFWIDCFTLVALTLLPIVITVVQEYLFPKSRVDASRDGVVEVESDSSRPIGARVRLASVIAVVILAVLVVFSMHDWVRFYKAGIYQSLISYNGARETAMAKAAKGAGNGLVLTDPCVDPQTLKIVSGARDVYMNFGMAWPEKYKDVLQLEASRGDKILNVKAAGSAGVDLVMTDTACDADWSANYGSSLTKVDSAKYSTGATTESIVLWRFDPGAG